MTRECLLFPYLCDVIHSIMPLRCGIIGLSGCGKTTLFNSLSEHHAQTGAGTKANMGTIQVPDQRLSAINLHVKAAREVPATVEMVDIPGLARGGTGIGTQFLSEIRNVDALVHVVRCFENSLFHHPEGSIDPLRDREIVDLELQIRDIESVEKKIQKLEKLAKSGDREARHGIDVLHRYKTHLESVHPARTAPIPPEDRKFIADLCLLTDKPVMYLCNVDDSAASLGNSHSERFIRSVASENAEVLILAAMLESEIASLELIKDRAEFLTDAGLQEPGVSRLVRAAYHLLDLQTFFTTGPKEVRAWTLTRGMTASQAAGVIHSDMERGFIRAEVMRSEDFIRLGSEHACRESGKLMVEGRNYIVKDGDMLHIRFNV